MGEGYGKFDSAGKSILLDKLKDVAERWQVGHGLSLFPDVWIKLKARGGRLWEFRANTCLQVIHLYQVDESLDADVVFS